MHNSFTFLSPGKKLIKGRPELLYAQYDENAFNDYRIMHGHDYWQMELVLSGNIQVKSKGFNLDAKAMDLNLAAVIPVDLFGLPVNLDEIKEIAENENIKILVDAAQSFGAEINNRRVGSMGDATTTSFFPAKPLGCYGDGGAVFTNDDILAEKVNSLRLHGKGDYKYDNVNIGLNSRLDTIQAAILIEKLKIFPNELKLRQLIANSKR